MFNVGQSNPISPFSIGAANRAQPAAPANEPAAGGQGAASDAVDLNRGERSQLGIEELTQAELDDEDLEGLAELYDLNDDGMVTREEIAFNDYGKSFAKLSLKERAEVREQIAAHDQNGNGAIDVKSRATEKERKEFQDGEKLGVDLDLDRSGGITGEELGTSAHKFIDQTRKGFYAKLEQEAVDNPALGVEGSPERRARMDQLVEEFVAENGEMLDSYGLRPLFEAKNAAGNHQVGFDALTAREGVAFLNDAVGEAVQGLMEKYDHDQDGTIELDPRRMSALESERSQAIDPGLDLDGDEQVTPKEARKYATDTVQALREHLVGQLDAESTDPPLSPEQREAKLEELLANLIEATAEHPMNKTLLPLLQAKDADGKSLVLSDLEAPVLPQALKGKVKEWSEELFQKNDLTGDRSISLAELKTPGAGILRAADKQAESARAKTAASLEAEQAQAAAEAAAEAAAQAQAAAQARAARDFA